ncbi:MULTISPECIES: XdhC/CoxI family protein [Arthrobacter]|uniref:XdhC family protein n=2 Tax=Arthrobacter TaxID=1663 RepID=A0ABU9KM43_9MICC|nr:XdhC/CoxI family protein [Arthrobacter sp. YJM1]MDP5227641.1 XdhC family protein [Arthrobacter sp. YJM1]
MLELGRHLGAWAPALAGEELVVATIVAASGSTPRPTGTSMLVAAGGQILGSLSGGCVEGAVVAAAQDVLACGGVRRERFGYSAEDAFAVGLSCGGELEVHLSRLDAQAREALESAPVALVRRLDGNDDDAVATLAVSAPSVVRTLPRVAWVTLLGLGAEASLVQDEVLERAFASVEALIRQGVSGLVRVAPPLGCHGTDAQPVELFVESRLPAPRAVVVGANDFSEALIPALKLLGYDVTLCDARQSFAAQERFAAADAVERSWPHRYLAEQAAQGLLDERSILCVLSHDPKFDVPLLTEGLRLDLAYVGALGSRRSDRHRRAALLEQGLEPGLLDRLHSPIGLDLGAVTPGEVAVSIAAELVAVIRRGPVDGAFPSGISLSRGAGPIHH